MTEKKTAGEQLAKTLFDTPENAYEALSEQEIDTVYAFSEGYRAFLNACKTEREAVVWFEKAAKEKGFTEFDRRATYHAGDKVYKTVAKKAIYLFVFGERTIDHGVKLAAAHIDAPRLDLKPRPFFEEEGVAFAKSHYYGGIKKYQWTAIPLALHGVVVRRDGTCVDVVIGENETDPVFTVTDLLPHLAKDQMTKNMAEGISGEALNVLIGSRPFLDDKASNRVKLNILKILNERYGVTERDFLSAELEIVPAFAARDVGLDRSFVGAYGQDDRVCAYGAAMGLLEVERPTFCTMCALVDKEETGSEGLTGMQSHTLQYLFSDIAAMQGVSLTAAYENSECFSADVTAAYDSNYPEVYEKQNSVFVNRGVGVAKYVGSRGKSGTSDANAEFFAKVASLLDENRVLWQVGELGKIDAGGGGTVAMYLANLGIETIDIGVPVLSMHAPFEVVSKTDVYMLKQACRAFFGQK
ncbi:aminopeptidase [Feifania hominis]|uniref:M18 family aminopeptidase n=1 Tax=Feifania hominis TaxID=2763660 RepID=A0A926DDV9_9FIRM|nr:aminopeptidase [Feifania hominis]MBC8535514.1 aminopeptidase [Feifania hominis]